MHGKNSKVSSLVDDCLTPESIAAHFADKYQDLYTSVTYDEKDMRDIVRDLSKLVSQSGYDKNCVITCNEVAQAISKLKPNKSEGHHGLQSDHIKQGCRELSVHLSFMLTAILCHGCAPGDMLVSTVIPIPKGSNINCTESANYRGICLSSIVGKVFDLIVLKRYTDCLITSDLQFGFKAKRSTNMCSLVLKECLSYCTSNRNTVYCTMLDATKAFDRVEYCKLFRQLLLKQIPPVIIRFLLNMYVNHVTRVAWNGISSASFEIRNGVKQGGILSPILFCIYFDSLLCELTKAGVGCYIGDFFVGALAYADDIVLLAPSLNAMRTMLNVCDRFAIEYDVVFNADKSKCLVIKPSRTRLNSESVLPNFSIGGNIIEVVHKWPHLGHIVSDTMSDKADIVSRRGSLIGQINNVLCHFGSLDAVTKVQLVKAYCTSFYGSELWDLWDSEIESVCKALRSGQRAIWKLPYNTHSRYLPMLCDSVPVFDELCRRYLGFINKCLYSDCKLVNFVARHGIRFGQMFSLCGRNALLCASRYSLSLDDICSFSFDTDIVYDHCTASAAIDLQTVCTIMELAYVRDGLYTLTSLSKDDVISLLNFICSV